MNCFKCECQNRLGNSKVIGQLISNKLSETDNLIILYYSCNVCDFKSTIRTQITTTKYWNKSIRPLLK